METKHDLKTEENALLKNEILENQQMQEQRYKGLETKLTEALENIHLLNKKVEEVQTENQNLQHEIEKIKPKGLAKNEMVEKQNNGCES